MIFGVSMGSFGGTEKGYHILTLLLSERPKLYTILVFLSAKELNLIKQHFVHAICFRHKSVKNSNRFTIYIFFFYKN